MRWFKEDPYAFFGAPTLHINPSLNGMHNNCSIYRAMWERPRIELSMCAS